MSSIDRTALVDALASATAETLKEDAARFERIANVYDRIGKELGNCDLTADTVQQVSTYRRLAALALAVAAMEDKFVEVYRPSPDTGWQAVAHNDIDWSEASTLPGVLANLIRDNP